MHYVNRKYAYFLLLPGSIIIYLVKSLLKIILASKKKYHIRARIHPRVQKRTRFAYLRFEMYIAKGGHWPVEIRKFRSNLWTSARFEGSTDRLGRAITDANARNRKL